MKTQNNQPRMMRTPTLADMLIPAIAGVALGVLATVAVIKDFENYRITPKIGPESIRTMLYDTIIGYQAHKQQTNSVHPNTGQKVYD